MEIYIDEAGRGPFAGPLYSGLLMIFDGKGIEEMGFRDSKQISEIQRERCLEKIDELKSEKKVVYSYGICDHKEIDAYGMTRAQSISIVRGLFQLLKEYYFDHLREKFGDKTIEKIFSQKEIMYKDVKTIVERIQDITGKNSKLVIDGKNKFKLDEELNIEVETIIDGDDLVTGISMASIIAKVNRDAMMKKMIKKYPKYLFDKHKGYGTKLHREMLEKYGICPIHRKLFLKNLFPEHTLKKFNSDFIVFG